VVKFLLLSMIELSFLPVLAGLLLYDQALGNPVYPDSERSDPHLSRNEHSKGRTLPLHWGFGDCPVQKCIRKRFHTGGSWEDHSC
jgi:hypothetical protein